MKFLLREFQKVHVANLLKRLKQAKRDLLEDAVLQAITLSAPTASGKTVMLTALIERVLFGKGGLEELDDLEFIPEPDAVFLWISDSPQLNQQSLEKMASAGSNELASRLSVVEASFDAERFEQGRVYFLNSQKLSTAGLLTKKGDGRNFSIWETINNSIVSQRDRFYVIIDEAHRGMRNTPKEQAQAATIVQKFILGSNGELTPAPIIVGLSATPDRFNAILSRSSRTRRIIDVPPNEARESGLIKDYILISHVTSKNPSEWTLLAAACEEFAAISCEWETYCKQNKEENVVRPVLVVQVEDARSGGGMAESRTSLSRLLEVIKQNVSGLTAINFAHCMESGKALTVGSDMVRYVEPHRIEHDQVVRVVIFKMALTTGWDCPRAEVMMSFRRAEDATYIAQLVGRIVRTPLARRMEGNDLLNSVMLYLPHYNSEELKRVVERLQSEGESGGAEAGEKDEFQTLFVATGKEDLLARYRTLPTYSAQEGRKVAHIRRALRIALELARDGWEVEGEKLRDGLRNRLLELGLERLKNAAFAKDLQGMTTVTFRTLRLENGELKTDDDGESHTLTVSEHDADQVFNRAFLTLSEELARSYVQNRFDPSDENAVYWHFKLEAFLLSQDLSAMTALEGTANELIEEAYELRKPDISNLPVERQAAYRRIMQTSREFRALEPSIPEPLRLKIPKGAASYADHLFVSEAGEFRANLNSWEEAVFKLGERKSQYAGWLRNYPRKSWSIAYIYSGKNGLTTPGYPDMVLFSRKGSHVVVDLAEPHDPGKSDSLSKAKGLCEFAERHGGTFGRIDWIKVEGRKVTRLNLNINKVRAAVLATNIDGAINSLFDLHGEVEYLEDD